MKRLSKIGLSACAALLVLAGCKENEEDRQHYDNRVFITTDSYTNYADEVRIERNSDKTDKELSRQITVGMAQPLGRDLLVTFREAPELLDAYRDAYYDPEVELLPEQHYDLSGAITTIAAGKVESEPLAFRFTGLDELDIEKRYVLPVTIASAGGVKVLPSAGTLYFVFKKASLVNVVADLNGNKAWPEFKDAAEVKDMETFTMEALVFFYAFNNNSTSPISTVMGIEDTFLIRVGDSNLSKNQLQVAYGKQKEDAETGATPDRGTVTDPSMQLKINRWYHVAVTFDHGRIAVYLDGKEKATGDASTIGLTAVNFAVAHSDETDYKPRCFWFGYSYDDQRPLNGRIAEARIWNRVLTAEEIAGESHPYRVNPDTAEGLVTYWKFDDGKGKTVKDWGPYGYDLTADHDLVWVSVELPEEE